MYILIILLFFPILSQLSKSYNIKQIKKREKKISISINKFQKNDSNEGKMSNHIKNLIKTNINEIVKIPSFFNSSFLFKASEKNENQKDSSKVNNTNNNITNDNNTSDNKTSNNNTNIKIKSSEEIIKEKLIIFLIIILCLLIIAIITLLLINRKQDNIIIEPIIQNDNLNNKK